MLLSAKGGYPSMVIIKVLSEEGTTTIRKRTSDMQVLLPNGILLPFSQLAKDYETLVDERKQRLEYLRRKTPFPNLHMVLSKPEEICPSFPGVKERYGECSFKSRLRLSPLIWSGLIRLYGINVGEDSYGYFLFGNDSKIIPILPRSFIEGSNIIQDTPPDIGELVGKTTRIKGRLVYGEGPYNPNIGYIDPKGFFIEEITR
jgi:hypothetical protein